jgi:hypothetical protein
VIATLKNGTEYVLRFGNLTNVSRDAKDADQAAQDEAAKKKSADSDVNRYLFVMARFDEGSVKQPELETLPELPAKQEDAPADEAASEEDAAQNEPASEVSDAAADEQPADEATADVDDAENADDAAAEDEATKKDETVADDAKAKEAGDKELEKIIADRQRIEQDNQRKLDEYQELLKKGRESVKELNVRFGDWYFVVDDDVFQKIRLSRDDVIKKKEKPKAEGEAADSTGEPAADGTDVPGLPSIPGATE